MEPNDIQKPIKFLKKFDQLCKMLTQLSHNQTFEVWMSISLVYKVMEVNIHDDESNTFYTTSPCISLYTKNNQTSNKPQK